MKGQVDEEDLSDRRVADRRRGRRAGRRVGVAFFGLGKWIADGNTFNKTMLECSDCPWNFTEERGFMIHGLNGFLIIRCWDWSS